MTLKDIIRSKGDILYEEDIKADIIKTCKECNNEWDIRKDGVLMTLKCGTLYSPFKKKVRCKECKALMEWAVLTEKEVMKE